MRRGKENHSEGNDTHTHAWTHTGTHTVYFNMLSVSKEHLGSLAEKTTYCS